MTASRDAVALAEQAGAVLGVEFRRFGRWWYYHDAPTDRYYRATLADLRLADAFRRNLDPYSLWCAATLPRPASARMVARIIGGQP